jgi:hypothetical protein
LKAIKLGYEVESGKEVSIRPAHLIVTGITQLSGKTTTLEALISRSGLKAIVFKTKIGERSFTQGTEVPPFFRDRSDYEFVKSLIEAYSREKLFLEKGTLMRLCKGSASLLDIKKKVDDEITTGKLRGLNQEIYTRLQHYLENLIPQIQYANLSNTLRIEEGINIMNLERFEAEAQSLIIQSVADEVLKTQHEVVIVIPEAWKFLPQKYNNPCKRAVESFIRQGAANHNFVWVDSQDMAGVDKSPLKQVSTWILGYQAERNEVKHTLDQISLPKKMKPKEDEIMTLKKGHFYLSSYEGVKKVYVQPTWLSDEWAFKIATGEEDVESVSAPQNLTPLARALSGSAPMPAPQDNGFQKELVELRIDFFNKIQELQNAIDTQRAESYKMQTASQPQDVDTIMAKVLQKMGPIQQVDVQQIVEQVMQRIPRGGGGAVYEVAPLEKLKRNFQEEAKGRIIKEINELSQDEKKVLKFIETQDKLVNVTVVLDKCLHLSTTGGGNRTKVSEIFRKFATLGFARHETHNNLAGSNLRARIADMMGTHGATDAEIDATYQHIIAAML